MLAVLTAVDARGHNPAETMVVASTADGGGQLALVFDFTTVARLSYSTTLGVTDVYTGGLPGLAGLSADSVPESLYVLDPGTQVKLVATGLDPGKTAVQIGATSIDAAGESAVIGTAPLADSHPEWQLLLTGDEPGEGTISFKLAATAPSPYTDSPIYTLRLSNGPIPPFAFDQSANDSAAVVCQKAIAKTLPRLITKTMSAMNRCLVAIADLQAHLALAVPPSNLVDIYRATESVCAGSVAAAPERTPLGKVEALSSAAEAAIAARCSGILDERAIADYVRSARCGAEQLLGEAFPGANAGLAAFLSQPAQGGDALSGHFPCLRATIGG